MAGACVTTPDLTQQEQTLMSKRSVSDSPPVVKVAGVYAIINQQSGRAYVGSSLDTDHRWAIHFWQLEKGTHRNTRLQADYDTDGLAGFVHFVLEEVSDPTQLRTVEQGWIRRLQANVNGYNIRASKRIKSTVAESQHAWARAFGKQEAA